MKIVTSIDGIEKYPVYAYSSFLKSFKGAVEIGYIVEEDIVLPFVLTKSYFLKTMHLPVELLGRNDINKQKDFLNRLPHFLRSNYKVTSVTTDNTAVFSSYPDDSKHCKFGSYIVDLSKSEDELFAALHSKHRNVIRKAQKDGIVIKHGLEYQKPTIALMNETYSRQGMAGGMDEEYLKRINCLGNNIEYWIAEDSEGNLQGSAIFLWSKGNSCYYLHGGSSEHTAPGAMNLLIWEAMLSMKERGVKYFDFVGARVNTEPGSKLEGIQRFKERFGSTLKEGYAFEIVVSKFEYFAARFLIQLKCRLRGVKLRPSIIEQEIQRGNV